MHKPKKKQQKKKVRKRIVGRHDGEQLLQNEQWNVGTISNQSIEVSAKPLAPEIAGFRVKNINKLYTWPGMEEVKI